MAVALSCLALAAPAAAISGSAGSADASAAQYLAPSQDTIAPGGGSGPGDEAVPLGEETPVAGAAPEEQDVLPAAPVASDDSGLPFTGYVISGVLGAGLLALLLGLLIRRFSDWRLA